MLVFQAFVACRFLRSVGHSHFIWMQESLLTGLCLKKKIQFEKQNSSQWLFWGSWDEREEEIWGIYLESGLSSKSGMLLPLFLYLLQWKADTYCFQIRICLSFPLYLWWMDINGYQMCVVYEDWHSSICCPSRGGRF